MNNNDVEHITRNDMSVDDEEGARARFLEHIETLAKNIRSGKTKVKYAMLAFATDLREDELPTDLPADQRAKLLENIEDASHQEIMGIGPGDDLMDLISQLPTHFAAPLIREHQAECTDPECAFNDPEVSKMLGPLKCMAKIVARVGASGNKDALGFLLHSLKDMCRKAGRIHAMEEAINRMMTNDGDADSNVTAGMIEVQGEQGLKVMKALADAGVLPAELAERVRNEIESETDLSDGAEIPEGSVLVRGGSKIKH